MFRGRLIEIRLLHIIILISLLILGALTYLFYIYFNQYFMPFVFIFVISLIIALIYFFVPNYYFYELSYLFKHNKKKIGISLFLILIISSLFFIPINLSFNLKPINFKSINLNLGLDNLFESSKKPSLEKPIDLNSDKGIVETTTKRTTTTKAITTTTKKVTTTTQKQEKDSEKRGFFFTKKENVVEDQPIDCTFDGRGHDAVLMPSGNYYCRSTQQRISIYIDGVEKICCVTPY
jgi:hypothetical protein